MTTLRTSKSIYNSDVLYARVTFMGQQLFNVKIRDMHSLSQVIDWVRVQLFGFTGLVKLSLRNVTQGWLAEHWFNLTPAQRNISVQNVSN